MEAPSLGLPSTAMGGQYAIRTLSIMLSRLRLAEPWSDWNIAHISPKEVYFTECAGTIGSDWWSDIKVRNSLFPAGFSAEVYESGTWITCKR